MESTESLALEAPTTQTQLREWAFAKRVLETVDVGVAWRDVYDPGADIEHRHHANGANALTRPEVGKLIQRLAAPALIAAGVERAFALRRLLQTIDSDLTDFVDTESPGLDEDGKPLPARGTFMTLAQIKANLPPEKRRLIRKYRETMKDGEVIKREIELEPKHQALELLARIQQLVQPTSLTLMNTETIINVITVAQSKGLKRAEQMRAELADSKTAGGIQRSAAAQKMLALPAPERETFFDPPNPGQLPEEP